MRYVRNMYQLLKSAVNFIGNMILSVIFFKNVKVFTCNHLTIGLSILHKQKVTLPHPVGIVIGQQVKIGYNCTIYQGVTIGTKDTSNYMQAKYPVIGDNVTIYANSVIFGDIQIGNNSIIGAGSIVTKNIPANSVAVGNPAKIIKML